MDIPPVKLYLDITIINPPKRGQSLQDVTHNYIEYTVGWPVTDYSDDLPTNYIVTKDNETFECRGSSSVRPRYKKGRKSPFKGEGSFVVTSAEFVNNEFVVHPKHPFGEPHGLSILDSALRQYEREQRS